MKRLLCFFLLACNDKSIVAEVNDSAIQNADSDTNDSEDDTVIEDNSPSSEPSEEPSSEPSTEDTAEPPPLNRSFILALGDGGEGNETQYAVAAP